MQIWKTVAVGLLLCLVLAFMARSERLSATPAPAASNSKKNASVPATVQSDGERVFKQNCSRCHAEPEGFSSHISGTIVRHMRVRASLSREDERALLKFLNP